MKRRWGIQYKSTWLEGWVWYGGGTSFVRAYEIFVHDTTPAYGRIAEKYSPLDEPGEFFSARELRRLGMYV